MLQSMPDPASKGNSHQQALDLESLRKEHAKGLKKNRYVRQTSLTWSLVFTAQTTDDFVRGGNQKEKGRLLHENCMQNLGSTCQVLI